jgi:protein phosphatase methylesterase 1
MQCFLSSRPKQFTTQQKAIEYMVRSGQVRNIESARVSIIGQIQPINNTQSNETDSSAFPTVSHLCETVQEEDEEEEEGGTEKSPVNIEQPTTTNESNQYTWRLDLSKTEKFWQGWFSGL